MLRVIIVGRQLPVNYRADAPTLPRMRPGLSDALDEIEIAAPWIALILPMRSLTFSEPRVVMPLYLFTSSVSASTASILSLFASIFALNHSVTSLYFFSLFLLYPSLYFFHYHLASSSISLRLPRFIFLQHLLHFSPLLFLLLEFSFSPSILISLRICLFL